MLASSVHWGSLVLWLAVMIVIGSGAAHAAVMLLFRGAAAAVPARKRVARSIIAGLGLTTISALLATTQLHSWSAIGLFTTALALRHFVKAAEERLL